MSFAGHHHTEDAKRRQSVNNTGKRRSKATRQKLRKRRLGKKDSEETKAKKRANLERLNLARWGKHTWNRAYPATECDFCGELGSEENKSTIRYGDEDLTVGLCPRCFAQWQQKPDDAVIISIGKGQEQSA